MQPPPAVPMHSLPHRNVVHRHAVPADCFDEVHSPGMMKVCDKMLDVCFVPIALIAFDVEIMIDELQHLVIVLGDEPPEYASVCVCVELMILGNGNWDWLP